MIFVTIGSMFPFDRLIRAMDAWTAASGRTDVFAQIGDGNYIPHHMEYVRRLSQSDFFATMERAEITIAHAGMGTVITAGRVGRPVVLVPRMQERGEHTTDHQVATADWLRSKPGIFIADTNEDLADAITAGLAAASETGPRLSVFADTAFTDRIRAAILGFRK